MEDKSAHHAFMVMDMLTQVYSRIGLPAAMPPFATTRSIRALAVKKCFGQEGALALS
jgi:hypothetical protein